MFAPESSLCGIIAIAASYIHVAILVRKHENRSLVLKPALGAIAASGNPGTKNDVFVVPAPSLREQVHAASY